MATWDGRQSRWFEGLCWFHADRSTSSSVSTDEAMIVAIKGAQNSCVPLRHIAANPTTKAVQPRCSPSLAGWQLTSALKRLTKDEDEDANARQERRWAHPRNECSQESL